ncbi:diguanylate cyclase domain-containing protein [Halomonas rhizosphaerae]|uniref:Diguanylate cyclase n=1 Tax=Halomonas rhizosphaerae TaxID=3043296 RepID=A0ABT6V0U0_9GAMM|nr:diguanylate cyclase [Halomonas rhizosphaerae]MDI5891536.1 diguanylate cyclase [Halomonas rhizosphaerae]MDI5919849.1 diguanylate cyclase [Halomonas rhizosphaerae]
MLQGSAWTPLDSASFRAEQPVRHGPTPRVEDFPGRKATLVARRDIAAALDAEKAWARVALDTIGDAVLTIDLHGAVTHMNRVAETLTGWSQPEAIGKPLSRVFHLVDGKTHQTTVTPGRRAIEENRAVGLALDCVLVRQDGSKLAIEDSAAPIHDREGRVIGAVIVFHDASQSQVMLERIAYQAQHDALTGLPNRALLTERLSRAIGLARRHRHLVALLYLDLDDFKPINDSFGHAVGDSLLQAVASRVQDCMRDIDTVCRQGGDEFVILLAEIRRPEDATRVAEKLLAVLGRPYGIQGHELLITLSIGISLYPDDADDADTLMHNADTAMYHAKRNGRNGHHCFTAEMNTRPLQRRRTEPGLHPPLQPSQYVFDF